MPQRIWARYSTSLLFLAILLLAGGLRFWNVTHDSDLAASVSSDAPEKFNEARQLARDGAIFSQPNERYLLYNQPLFVIRSYAAIWQATAKLGLPTDDQRMRVGFTAYMILFSLGTLVLVFLIGRLVFGESAPALLASLLFAVFPVNVMGSLYVKRRYSADVLVHRGVAGDLCAGAKRAKRLVSSERRADRAGKSHLQPAIRIPDLWRAQPRDSDLQNTVKREPLNG